MQGLRGMTREAEERREEGHCSCNLLLSTYPIKSMRLRHLRAFLRCYSSVLCCALSRRPRMVRPHLWSTYTESPSFESRYLCVGNGSHQIPSVIA